MHTWFHVQLDQKILDGLYVQTRQPRRPRSVSRLRPASAEFPASVEIVEDHIGQARGRVRYRDSTASALHGEKFLEYSNYRGFPHYAHFGV